MPAMPIAASKAAKKKTPTGAPSMQTGVAIDAPPPVHPGARGSAGGVPAPVAAPAPLNPVATAPTQNLQTALDKNKDFTAATTNFQGLAPGGPGSSGGGFGTQTANEVLEQGGTGGSAFDNIMAAQQAAQEGVWGGFDQSMENIDANQALMQRRAANMNAGMGMGSVGGGFGAGMAQAGLDAQGMRNQAFADYSQRELDMKKAGIQMKLNWLDNAVERAEAEGNRQHEKDLQDQIAETEYELMRMGMPDYDGGGGGGGGGWNPASDGGGPQRGTEQATPKGDVNQALDGADPNDVRGILEDQGYTYMPGYGGQEGYYYNEKTKDKIGQKEALKKTKISEGRSLKPNF